MKFGRIVTVAALSAALVACGGDAPEATADAGGETADGVDLSIIEVRQDNLEEMGDAFKAIRGELEKGSPDFSVLASAADTINNNAGLIKDHFPEGTGPDSGVETEALNTIWERPDEFAGAADKLVAASEELQAAAASQDIAQVQEAVKNLGGSCKGCHDEFRLDKD